VRGVRSITRPRIGLGLATVKRLVVAHGGAVETRRGTLGGALFSVELPRASGGEQRDLAANEL
jgi:signal transduction histidine kinase